VSFDIVKNLRSISRTAANVKISEYQQ
jgi:hypothetical protein